MTILRLGYFALLFGMEMSVGLLPFSTKVTLMDGYLFTPALSRGLTRFFSGKPIIQALQLIFSLENIKSGCKRYFGLSPRLKGFSTLVS